MADFHQNGVVATLHNLRERSLHEMERELAEFARSRPITLILPSLFFRAGKPGTGQYRQRTFRGSLPCQHCRRPRPGE